MLKRLGKPKKTDADFASKSLYAGELYLSLFCASEIYFLSKILSALNLKSSVFDLKTLKKHIHSVNQKVNMTVLPNFQYLQIHHTRKVDQSLNNNLKMLFLLT